MKIPEWTKPAITGAIFGAVATMALGFTLGGWHSSASAIHLADQQSAAAVIKALAPVCVGQSKLDPDSAGKIKLLTAMVTGYERRDYVMKAGWATVAGSDSPDRDVAAACADILVKPPHS